MAPGISDTRILHGLVEREQEKFLDRTVRQMRARYQSQHVRDMQLLTFGAWLVSKQYLENTFDTHSFSYGERLHRAHTVIERAERLTYGTSALRASNLDWFVRGLQKRFLGSIDVTLVRRPQNKVNQQLSLRLEHGALQLLL